jgi:hypothetical protein
MTLRAGSLRGFTRELMDQASRDLGTRLDCVAIDHWKTEPPSTFSCAVALMSVLTLSLAAIKSEKACSPARVILSRARAWSPIRT